MGGKKIMKFNIKKITSVLASFAMIGSTMGFAVASNYPSPFVIEGGGDVAVIIGSNSQDQIAAIDIGTSLAQSITSDSPTPTGESILFEKSSTKLQMGYGLKSIVSGYIDDNSPKDGFPTLLAKGKYLDDNNDEYDYSQKIEMADLSLTMWEDSDYEEDEPTIGFQIKSGDPIFSYVLKFMDSPPVDEMETTSINILGEDYFILDADETKLTLLDDVESTTLSEKESTTFTINGITYDITLDFVGTETAVFTVNGETTNDLEEGDTQKISDAYIGIKSIRSQNYAGGVRNVEFSIGDGKFELEDDREVEINGDDIEGMTAHITSSDDTISKLVIEWNADEDLFITETQELVMRGFEAVKLTFTGMTYPEEEHIKISAYNDEVIMLEDFPLETSTEDIFLLHSVNATSFNESSLGKDDDSQLAVSDTTELMFDENIHEYFIVSYNDESNAESYLMKVSNFEKLSDDTNETTFYYKEDGYWVEAETAGEGDVVSPGGSVEFTIDYVDEDKEQVIISAGTNVEFNMLYSAEGLQLSLPIISDSIETWNLVLVEEDRNEDIGDGETITLSIGIDSEEVSVEKVTISGSEFEEIGDTDVWRGFVYSAIGTEVLWDKSSEQKEVELIYHGEESYGNFYLSENLEFTSPSETIVTVYDNEVSKVSDKNLIVVGGSCINEVAMRLVGGIDVPLCGSDWTMNTGSGANEWLIETYNSPYALEKIAVLVAGYEKKDTTNAIKYLIENKPDVSIIGTRIEGPILF